MLHPSVADPPRRREPLAQQTCPRGRRRRQKRPPPSGGEPSTGARAASAETWGCEEAPTCLDESKGTGLLTRCPPFSEHPALHKIEIQGREPFHRILVARVRRAARVLPASPGGLAPAPGRREGRGVARSRDGQLPGPLPAGRCGESLSPRLRLVRYLRQLTRRASPVPRMSLSTTPGPGSTSISTFRPCPSLNSPTAAVVLAARAPPPRP